MVSGEIFLGSPPCLGITYTATAPEPSGEKRAYAIHAPSGEMRGQDFTAPSWVRRISRFSAWAGLRPAHPESMGATTEIIPVRRSPASVTPARHPNLRYGTRLKTPRI